MANANKLGNTTGGMMGKVEGYVLGEGEGDIEGDHEGCTRELSLGQANWDKLGNALCEVEDDTLR